MTRVDRAGAREPGAGTPVLVLGEAMVRGRRTRASGYAGGASHGGARAGNASPASVDNPRWVSIRRITAGSPIVASATSR
jgi:hypothetical protein